MTKNLSAMGEVGDTSLTLENGALLKTEMRYAALGGVKSFKDANNRTTTFDVDALGRTVSASYPTTPQVSESFQYDGEGLLISHSDRRGVASTMTYDNLRRELESVTGGIRVMKHDYNNAGRTETKTDANNHATLCVYDGLMRLVSLTNADGKVKSYEYDGENLIRESDFKGKKSEYRYDVINRLIEVKDRTAAQLTTISHVDAGGHKTDTTDRRGNHRVEVYDPLDRLSNVTDGGQPLASYEYDANSNRVAMSDGRGNRSVYEYDRANRVKQILHAGSLQTEAFVYDGVGNALSYNDGFGANVTMSYDALDHPLTRTDGVGNVMRYKYDGEGLLLERVEPKGATGAGFKTSYDYNALRSVKEVRDAKGGVWTYGYDAAQNLTGMTDGLNRVTSYEYDVLNRLTKVTQPNSLVTQYEYDQNSNRTAVIDAKGQRSNVAYDELDRARQADYLAAGGGLPAQGARQQQFGYDPEGNLTSVQESTAVNGTATTRNYSRTYDARDRLVTATDGNNRVVSYAYDATNNVTSVTDAASKQTSYSYDALNRLSSVQMSGGRTANYSWKADGLLESVQYPSGMSRAYSYDNADRLTSVTNNLGSGASEEFSYSYDGNSNRESESRKRDGASYKTLSYQYDELDRLTSVGYGGAASQGLKGEYFNNRDFTGRALIRTDATVDFSWTGTQTPAPSVQDDSFSVRWTGKVEAQFAEAYTFYAQSDEAVKVWVNGQLVIDDATDHTTREASGSITLAANQKYDIKIEYSENTGDALVKLSWASASQTKQVIPQSRLFVADATSYSYDAVGNRLSESGVDFAGAPINRSYSYDPLNRLQSVTGDVAGSLSFTYDANGNQTSQTQGAQTTRYEYDTRDQMRRVLSGASGSTEIASFDYDFSRRRLSKTASGITTSFVYDGSQIINEYGANGALVNRYDYGADLLRGELGGEGERFYFSDALGSTTALSSSSGGVASRFEYDAWGVMSASSSVSANPVGYTGQRLDTETGLMALGNGERYYAPQFGQFIQQDSFTGSLTNPQSMNRHSYVHNNPIIHTDPSGHLVGAVIVVGLIVLLAVEVYKKKTEHDLERAKGYESENGGNTWALGLSDAFGMTQLFRGATGVDPYTGEEVHGWQRVRDIGWGATQVFLNATLIGGSIYRGGKGALGLLRSEEVAWESVRRLKDTEPFWRQSRQAWDAIKHPIETTKAAGKLAQESYTAARSGLAELTAGGARATAQRALNYARESIAPRFNPKNYRREGTDVFYADEAGSLANDVARTAARGEARRISGARELDPFDFEGAEQSYKVIRQASDDVAAIAKNTGIRESRIARIKEHLFERTHQLDDAIRRFDADPEIANAWQRLKGSTHTAKDLQLLEHELFESRFEGIFRTNYRTAHDAANRSGRPSGLE